LVTGSYRQGARFVTSREHGTRDWLLVYNLEGHARFGHAQGELVTGPGAMILLKPNTRHDYGTATGHPFWEPLWAHFIPRTAWLEWLEWPEAAPGILLLQLAGQNHQSRIVRRFRDMLRLNASAHRQREALAMNALEEILLWCDLSNPHHETTRLDRRIRRALDHISEHLAEPLAVATLATQCGLSPSHFARLFRAQIGETPQRYLELRRLGRARQLLEFTQEPIRLIARQVGFDNPFYFTLRFKRHSGLGPRDWRQRRARGRT
jgi:AraC family transcriptional regulator of arabinose operon